MANVLAPFGFAETARLGAAPNYQMSRRWIAPANTTAIYFGDPIVQLSTGYITQATPGSTQIGGIFAGCTYYSLRQKKPIWSRYWPAVTTDVRSTVNSAFYIVEAPQAVSNAQSNGHLPFTMIGETVQFAIGTGSTTTGFSGATID